jgi:hypothetical protein
MHITFYAFLRILQCGGPAYGLSQSGARPCPFGIDEPPEDTTLPWLGVGEALLDITPSYRSADDAPYVNNNASTSRVRSCGF